MILLLDSSRHKIDEIARRLGIPEYAQLQTPLTRYSTWAGPWAADNGGFTRQNWRAYERFLKNRQEHVSRCMWATAPDVVGSAKRTLELLPMFAPRLRSMGYPVCLVAQDGIEHEVIPWAEIDAIFIGGTDRWRESDAPKQVIAAARWLGLWTHVGRVNTLQRWKYFEKLGVDSCDGSGLARYSERMRKGLMGMNCEESPAPHADAIGSSQADALLAEQWLR